MTTVFRELNKFNVKVNVIPNGIEKYKTYLTKEFGSKTLELLKQKGGYSYDCANNFKRFNEKNCLIENIQKTQKKMKQLVRRTRSFEDYLMCENIWNVFGMKNMGNHHDHF